MRAYDHDHDGSGALSPRSVRVDSPGSRVVSAAAAAGRWDVVGAAGLQQLQRAVGNEGVSAALALQDEEPSPVLDVISSGGGQPLDAGVRSDMEARLGHDFGDVRVHTDAKAEESAKSVNALAYTVGSDIVFQRDSYNPSSEAGRVTLAHELTHVIQQRSGPVEGTAAPGGIMLSDPSDRFEREAAANAVAAVQRQESGEQRPESDEQRPESGEQRPESGEQRPESGEQRPESGEQRPESGEREEENEE